jgi:hypothetical protein
MKTSGDRICKTCRYWSELIVRYGGRIVLLRRFALIAKGHSIAFSVAAPSAARPGQAGIWGRSMTRICQKELMPTMKIEALTEHYQTRRKTALNRVPVEPEKFARLPPGRASRKTLIACIQTLSPTTATNCHARRLPWHRSAVGRSR